VWTRGVDGTRTRGGGCCCCVVCCYNASRLIPPTPMQTRTPTPPTTNRNETRDAIENGLKKAAGGDEGAVTFCVTRRGKDGKVRACVRVGMGGDGWVEGIGTCVRWEGRRASRRALDLFLLFWPQSIRTHAHTRLSSLSLCVCVFCPFHRRRWWASRQGWTCTATCWQRTARPTWPSSHVRAMPGF
jgi:hypothetical protein